MHPVDYFLMIKDVSFFSLSAFSAFHPLSFAIFCNFVCSITINSKFHSIEALSNEKNNFIPYGSYFICL